MATLTVTTVARDDGVAEGVEWLSASNVLGVAGRLSTSLSARPLPDTQTAWLSQGVPTWGPGNDMNLVRELPGELELMGMNGTQSRGRSQVFLREKVVGARGFEPPTPRSRTECSTRLSHAPTQLAILPQSGS